MLIHLPVVENRIAQFAARFERHGKGWVYHGDRLTGGLPVSDAEHGALLAENARMLRRSERVMWWWLPIAVVACVAWEVCFGEVDRATAPWAFVPVLLLLPWVFQMWWQADRLAVELAGRRLAITAPPDAGRAVATCRAAARHRRDAGARLGVARVPESAVDYRAAAPVAGRGGAGPDLGHRAAVDQAARPLPILIAGDCSP